MFKRILIIQTYFNKTVKLTQGTKKFKSMTSSKYLIPQLHGANYECFIKQCVR